MKLFSVHTKANSNPSTQHVWTMPLRAKLPIPIQQQQQILQNSVTVTPPPEKKVKWGEPIWFFLHTLSVKVKEREFHSIRANLLNHIYAICTNLPCPDCSNHAKTYLDGVNFNTIQTKTDLKKLLHAFHNEVNRRKGYPFFPYEKVDEKYSLAITNNIIRNFMAHFSDRNRSLKLLATDLHRARLCEFLKTWFNENIRAFDP